MRRCHSSKRCLDLSCNGCGRPAAAGVPAKSAGLGQSGQLMILQPPRTGCRFPRLRKSAQVTVLLGSNYGKSGTSRVSCRSGQPSWSCFRPRQAPETATGDSGGIRFAASGESTCWPDLQTSSPNRLGIRSSDRSRHLIQERIDGTFEPG